MRYHLVRIVVATGCQRFGPGLHDEKTTLVVEGRNLGPAEANASVVKRSEFFVRMRRSKGRCARAKRTLARVLASRSGKQSSILMHRAPSAPTSRKARRSTRR